MKHLLADLRDAFSSLLRAKVMLALTIPMLATSIAICLATASIVKTVFYDPLPVEQPNSLYEIGHIQPDSGVTFGAFSPDDFEDLKHNATGFESLSSYMYWKGQSTANIVLDSGPIRVNVAYVDRSYFSTLGAKPRLGSLPQDNESHDDGAVVAWSAWQKLLTNNQASVGNSLRINGKLYPVLAVMPENFIFPSSEVDVWLPISALTAEDIPRSRDVRWLNVIGRAKPGLSHNYVQRDVDRVLGALARDYPSSNLKYAKSAVVPISETLVGDGKLAVITLVASLALVAIAILNVSGLMSLRIARNSYSDAIRVAVGSPLEQLKRIYVLQAMLLVTVATLLAAPIAYAITIAATRIEFIDLPKKENFHLDFGLLMLAILVSAIAGLLSVLAPISTLKLNKLGRTLMQGRVDSGSVSAKLRTTIVMLQMICLTALAYASLTLTLHLHTIISTDLGIDGSRINIFQITLQGKRYDSEKAILEGRRQILEALSDAPGVSKVAASKTPPIGQIGERYGIKLDPESDWITPEWGFLFVTPEYFSVLGVKTLSGSLFNGNEAVGSELPIVVNKAFEDRYSGGKTLINRAIWTGLSGKARIVGVVANIRHEGASSDAKPALYAPFHLFGRYNATILLKSDQSWSQLSSEVDKAVWSVDSELPITNGSSLDAVINRMTANRKFISGTLVVFCGISLLVVVAGVFSLTNSMFESRRRESLIRLVLGAKPYSILARHNKYLASLLATSLVMGLPLGIFICSLSVSTFEDLDIFSPTAMGAVVLFSFAVGFLTSIPAMVSLLRLSPAELLKAQ